MKFSPFLFLLALVSLLCLPLVGAEAACRCGCAAVSKAKHRVLHPFSHLRARLHNRGL